MGSLIKLYTDKSIDYLKNRRDPNKPFVLYLAHTMMHTIIDASPGFRGTSAGDLYGDVVEEFDFETGRLLDALDELGLSDNTLIIYTSDNGPWNQTNYTAKKKGHPEGSIFWGEKGPLRAGKGSVYEAGHRVPCIVRWPGKVPAGRVSNAIFATIDFMPTIANLAGYKVPGDRAIDGIDQTDLLLGKAKAGRKTFFYDQINRNNLAVRSGKWKLLAPGRYRESYKGYLMDFGTNDYELYNLETDLGESRNVILEQPEIVDKLKKLLKEHIDETSSEALPENIGIRGNKTK
jgi:arylsulfatase A-like enzyme